MGVKVSDVRRLITGEASIVHLKDDLKHVAKEIVRDPKTRTVYVVDERGRLKGLIPVKLLIQVLYFEYIPEELLPYELLPLAATEARAKDIMLPPVYVKEDESVEDALTKMFKHDLQELPVVDDEIRVIGDLNILELIIAWLKSQESSDKESEDSQLN